MADDFRRQLLRRTDNILEGIERSRLRDARNVPQGLRAEVGKVASELGQSVPTFPMGLAATHSYVFHLQTLLLRSAGPRRPALAISNSSHRDNVPVLALPERRGTEEGEWRDGVRLTVQRARDLVRYLDAQAQAARRQPGREGSALASKRSYQAHRAEQQYARLLAQALRVLGHAPVLDDHIVLTSGRLAFQDLVIDHGYESIRHGDRVVQLTPLEHRVLSVLATNQGKVVTREALLHLVYGDDPDVSVRTNVIDVHLGRVRSKLGNPPYLETVRGIGFRASGPAIALSSQPDVEQVRQTRRDLRQKWAQERSAPTGDRARKQPRPGDGPARWQANRRY